jgi:hypothetical protein
MNERETVRQLSRTIALAHTEVEIATARLDATIVEMKLQLDKIASYLRDNTVPEYDYMLVFAQRATHAVAMAETVRGLRRVIEKATR